MKFVYHFFLPFLLITKTFWNKEMTIRFDWANLRQTFQIYCTKSAWFQLPNLGLVNGTFNNQEDKQFNSLFASKNLDNIGI